VRVALTGATGAVGAAVAAALAARGDTVRAIGRRAETVWDLRTPLPEPVRRLVGQVDAVVHCAADIRLGGRPELLRRVNTDATRELVAAAAAAEAPPRFVHVSSAFVEVSGRSHENAYELSKLEAEEAVLSSELDAVILRPSVVIGSTADGAIARFRGVYATLRLLTQGLFPAIPADQNALIDIVPVDLVAAAVSSAVRGEHRRGSVINVTAGESSPTVGWLFGTACEVIERVSELPLTRPPFVSPDRYRRLFRPLVLPELSGAQRVVLETVELFLPYLARSHAFPPAVTPDPELIREAWRRGVAYWARHAGARPLSFPAWTPRGRA
jgi:nucleoside-diphosphate-sugar epimerase